MAWMVNVATIAARYYLIQTHYIHTHSLKPHVFQIRYSFTLECKSTHSKYEVVVLTGIHLLFVKENIGIGIGYPATVRRYYGLVLWLPLSREKNGI